MKIVSVSLVIFFGSIIPLSYVHELGHGYVCMMEGYDFDVQLGLDGGRMVCHGEIENQILFRASGGVLAGIAALIPLMPVTPPPGCVPALHKYKPFIGVEY